MQARNQLLISEIVKNKEIITLLWKKYNLKKKAKRSVNWYNAI